jgi:hypothetical protein
VAKHDKAVSPGQEGKVTLTVKTKNMRGKITKGAKVYLNDPKQPVVRLTLQGTVKPYINVDPRDRVYLRGFIGEVAKESLTITSNEEGPFTISAVKTNVEDKIDHNLTEVEPGKKYQLDISSKPGLLGRFRGKITLSTNSKQKPQLVVNVSGSIRSEVMVSPSKVYFGNIKLPIEPAAAKPFSRTVTVRTIRGAGLKIEKLTSDSDVVRTELATTKDGEAYTITVTLDSARLAKGDLKSAIHIFTNYEKQPVYDVEVLGKVI